MVHLLYASVESPPKFLISMNSFAWTWGAHGRDEDATGRRRKKERPLLYPLSLLSLCLSSSLTP